MFNSYSLFLFWNPVAVSHSPVPGGGELLPGVQVLRGALLRHGGEGGAAAQVDGARAPAPTQAALGGQGRRGRRHEGRNGLPGHV